MTRKSKTKPFLTKDDYAAMKAVDKLVSKCQSTLAAIDNSCCLHHNQDPDRSKWKHAKRQMQQLLKELESDKFRLRKIAWKMMDLDQHMVTAHCFV